MGSLSLIPSELYEEESFMSTKISLSLILLRPGSLPTCRKAFAEGILPPSIRPAPANPARAASIVLWWNSGCFCVFQAPLFSSSTIIVESPEMGMKDAVWHPTANLISPFLDLFQKSHCFPFERSGQRMPSPFRGAGSISQNFFAPESSGNSARRGTSDAVRMSR